MTIYRHVALLILLGPVAALAGGPDLGSDDAALIKHIKSTDRIFTAVLGD